MIINNSYVLNYFLNNDNDKVLEAIKLSSKLRKMENESGISVIKNKEYIALLDIKTDILIFLNEEEQMMVNIADLPQYRTLAVQQVRIYNGEKGVVYQFNGTDIVTGFYNVVTTTVSKEGKRILKKATQSESCEIWIEDIRIK